MAEEQAVTGVVDEGFLQGKITEVAEAAKDAKPFEPGNVVEQEIGGILNTETNAAAGADKTVYTDPKVKLEDLPEAEPEKFADDHKNKKTATNPRGAGHKIYNDECTCLKCRWLTAHASQPGTSTSADGTEQPGATIPDNVDVISVAENKFLLAPCEKIFGMHEGSLQITSEEQLFLNMFKPEDSEIKRSWKIYGVMNALIVLSKGMVVVTKWFIKPLARFREPEIKKAA